MRMEDHGRRRMLAAGWVAIAVSAAGCGGGGFDSEGQTADRLTCPKTCTPSSTVAIDQIRPTYKIVSDGQKVEALAGFNTGRDPRFNVEIDGSDSLRLATPSGTHGFHIPGIPLGASVVGAVEILFIGATPYSSTVTAAQGETPVQFQFVRGTTVYSSSVTLPAPFEIAAPAAATVLPVTTRTLPLRLTTGAVGTVNTAELKCTDTNGNTSSDGGTTLRVVTVGPQAPTGQRDYTVDLGAALDAQTFTTKNPRGAVASCDMVLTVSIDVEGELDAHFLKGGVSARQYRKANVALR